MTNRVFIIRALLIIALSTAISHWVIGSMRMEQDLLRSFGGKESVTGNLINEYQRRGPLAAKIFIDEKRLSPDDSAFIHKTMLKAGYTPAADTLINSPQIKAGGALLAAEWLKQTSQIDSFTIKSARDLAGLLSLPGTADLALSVDPLGLLRLFPTTAEMTAAQNGMTGQAITIWTSPRPYQHNAAANIWALAERFENKANFIGEDLFRFTNEQAVRRDVAMASAVSLVLNAIVFLLFIRSWTFLGIFLAGTAVSWVFLCLALKVCFNEVYPIVFGFASTFFSFNAEYLVHLCGIESNRRHVMRKAMLSAVGTTVIGLVVLLASSSPLIRQMSVAAIAGLTGFFVGTMPFASMLSTIGINVNNNGSMTQGRHQTSTFSRPTVRSVLGGLRPWTVLCVACLGVVLVLGAPTTRTDVSQFRFAPELLVKSERYFMGLLPADTKPYAIKKDDITKIGRDFSASVFNAAASVTTDPGEATQAVKSITGDVTRKARALGIDMNQNALFSAYHLDTNGEQADPRQAASMLAGTAILGDGQYAVVTANEQDAKNWNNQGIAAVKMDARAYYNDLLTDHAREIMVLFLISFAGMLIYLAAIQRSLHKVIVIMMPLVIFFAMGAATLSALGVALNIIHVLGLTLVIGFSLDYTAIAVSTEFTQSDMAKITITGASTIASFAGLSFAEHPFLRMLGLVVVPGVALSLLFAVVIDRTKISNFVNQRRPIKMSSSLLIALLTVMVTPGCVTPREFSTHDGKPYSHPLHFTAEQSVCVVVKGTKNCFVGELRRVDETFYLTLMEPSILTVLMASESSATGKTVIHLQAKNELLDRFEPKFTLDVIRQLHTVSPPVMTTGSVTVPIPDGHEFKVRYTWGDLKPASCPYPETLTIEFPPSDSRPAITLNVTNRSVTCDDQSMGEAL